MNYPKPWKISNVNLDPPSNIPGKPRLSTIEILDNNNQKVCTIHAHSQPVAKEIVNSINLTSKLKQYIYNYGWCGYYGEAYDRIDGIYKGQCYKCYDKDGCERYNILKLWRKQC